MVIEQIKTVVIRKQETGFILLGVGTNDLAFCPFRPDSRSAALSLIETCREVAIGLGIKSTWLVFTMWLISRPLDAPKPAGPISAEPDAFEALCVSNETQGEETKYWVFRIARNDLGKITALDEMEMDFVASNSMWLITPPPAMAEAF